jgi:hypothetical protein
MSFLVILGIVVVSIIGVVSLLALALLSYLFSMAVKESKKKSAGESK